MGQRRHSQGRRGWVSLVCGALAFAGLELGLSLLLESRRPASWDPPYAAKDERLRARLTEASGRPLVLMVGSSRTYYGLQAEQFSAASGGNVLAFNFGLLANGPVQELLCVRRLLDEGIRPALLVVEVMPATLVRGLPDPVEENWLNGGRLPLRELAWVRSYSAHPGRLLRQWCVARCLACTNLREELRRCLALEMPPIPAEGLPSGPMDGYGWQPGFSAVTAAQRALFVGLMARQYGNAFTDGRLAEQPVRALNELLDRCRAGAIPVALVLMPEASEFRALYTPAAAAHLHAFLDDLGRRRHLPVIDARTWVDDVGFWDGHHLLPAGAAAFTERFGRELLGPGQGVGSLFQAAVPGVDGSPRFNGGLKKTPDPFPKFGRMPASVRPAGSEDGCHGHALSGNGSLSRTPGALGGRPCAADCSLKPFQAPATRLKELEPPET